MNQAAQTKAWVHCKCLICVRHRWGLFAFTAINSGCQQKFSFIFRSWNLESHLFVSCWDIVGAGVPVTLQTTATLFPSGTTLSLRLIHDFHWAHLGLTVGKYKNLCHSSNTNLFMWHKVFHTWQTSNLINFQLLGSRLKSIAKLLKYIQILKMLYIFMLPLNHSRCMNPRSKSNWQTCSFSANHS